MNPDDRNLEALLADYLESEGASSSSELLQLCRDRPEALEALTDQILVRRLLKFAVRAKDAEAFAQEAVLKLNPAFRNAGFSASVQKRIQRMVDSKRSADIPTGKPPGLSTVARLESAANLQTRSLFRAAAVLTALLGLAAFLFFAWQRSASPSFAVVSNAVSPVWNAPADAKSVGDSVSQDRLSLRSGFTELTFQNGARVILEGPVDFEIQNANRARLISGNLAAFVPESAAGFTIDTPSARVVDLGTEFCLSVENDGDTELHVIEGKVRASSSNRKGAASEMVQVERNQARRFGRTESEAGRNLPADPTRFMRSLPVLSDQPANYVHWSFDEGRGGVSHDQGRGFEPGRYDARLSAIAPGSEGPAWVNGQYGHALEFDGIDDFVATDFPGIGGHDARTVAFWVKTPKDAETKNCYAMVSWGSYAGEGTTWQISWNSIAGDGPIGRLRTGMFHGQIIGNKDLRDDRWHHVAVVFYGGQDADVSTHALLYLDGELEMASRKSILKVQTDITSNEARKVMVGRNASVNNKSQRCFRGWIDEVFIFDAALNDYQIQHLMKTNEYIPSPNPAAAKLEPAAMLGTL